MDERLCNEVITSWKTNEFETNDMIAKATYETLRYLQKQIKDLKKERKQLIKANKSHQIINSQLNNNRMKIINYIDKLPFDDLVPIEVKVIRSMLESVEQ